MGMACGRGTLGAGRRGALLSWAWEITGSACNGFWDLAGVGVVGSKGQKETPRKKPLDPGKTTPAALAAQGTWQELLHQTGDSGSNMVGALFPRPWSSLVETPA